MPILEDWHRTQTRYKEGLCRSATVSNACHASMFALQIAIREEREVAMTTLPLQFGKYELRERLGHGGMAEVWKAMDTQLQRYVAIKLLHANLQNDPTFVTRFLREARMMASLRHPNIVQVHDFQVSTPSSEAESASGYMVMDYVEGQTLAQYI